MRTVREIYSISFNKHRDKDGGLHFYIYTLGVESINRDVETNKPRIPKKITKKDDKITVEFTDQSRHIIPYTDDVEIFDRIHVPKIEKDNTPKSN